MRHSCVSFHGSLEFGLFNGLPVNDEGRSTCMGSSGRNMRHVERTGSSTDGSAIG